MVGWHLADTSAAWASRTPALFAAAPPFPYRSHDPPQFLVGHVQVALCLLQVRVTQHQLNRTEVDSFRQQSARTLVPEVVECKSVRVTTSRATLAPWASRFVSCP
jgi:hypothetical protein